MSVLMISVLKHVLYPVHVSDLQGQIKNAGWDFLLRLGELMPRRAPHPFTFSIATRFYKWLRIPKILRYSLKMNQDIRKNRLRRTKGRDS